MENSEKDIFTKRITYFFFASLGPWQLVTKKFCFDVHELNLLEKVILSHITMHLPSPHYFSPPTTQEYILCCKTF